VQSGSGVQLEERPGRGAGDTVTSATSLSTDALPGEHGGLELPPYADGSSSSARTARRMDALLNSQRPTTLLGGPLALLWGTTTHRGISCFQVFPSPACGPLGGLHGVLVLLRLLCVALWVGQPEPGLCTRRCTHHKAGTVSRGRSSSVWLTRLLLPRAHMKISTLL